MDKIYNLRKDFAVIGITGRTGSGCSQIAKKLSNKNYIESLDLLEVKDNDVDAIKHNICLNYLKFENNWKHFTTIKYTNIVLFHLLYECCYNSSIEEAKLKLIKAICEKKGEFKRFSYDDNYYDRIENISNSLIENIHSVYKEYKEDTLNKCISKNESFYSDFFDNDSLLTDFTSNLKDINCAEAIIFFHDKANNLRFTSRALEESLSKIPNSDNVFTIVETINILIKHHRQIKDDGRIVIDSIKNSLELTFFKERYSAFYCLATNKLTDERLAYKKEKIKHSDPDEMIKRLRLIDDTEYEGGEVLEGIFNSPDIENCIQKSGYHIFYTNEYDKNSMNLKGEDEYSVNLDIQLVKFISLLFQPGIITPTAIERNMQIAFNAKANSGCISRQVGAVITDQNHSVKSIGWNDVAANQLPCNLRNLMDLNSNNNLSQFSDFEKNNKPAYEDGESFKEKAARELKRAKTENLKGKNCSFCFKTFHNVFEGKSNQVHTRSLHAEENAMLQLTKYGGQGIENGILYTTASPCELCSKKAFQLGIKEIFYIDPYPGIATKHILKSGKDPSHNPVLKMFRGAVGSTFHKLYEPTISYKDELNILADLHPKMNQDRIIRKLTKDKDKQNEINNILNS